VNKICQNSNVLVRGGAGIGAGEAVFREEKIKNRFPYVLSNHKKTSSDNMRIADITTLAFSASYNKCWICERWCYDVRKGESSL
jgi:hypothetical protein